VRVEDLLDESTFNWPFPPITQIPGSDGTTRSGVSLTTVDAMPFWLYGAVLSPMSEPKVPLLRILMKMKTGPLPKDQKLSYAERNLLDQAVEENLVELTPEGYRMTPEGQKYLDNFANVLNQLMHAMPHFYLTPAPLLTF